MSHGLLTPLLSGYATSAVCAGLGSGVEWCDFIRQIFFAIFESCPWAVRLLDHWRSRFVWLPVTLVFA